MAKHTRGQFKCILRLARRHACPTCRPGDKIPFFIEELVRGAAEAVGGRGDALKELPDTLQGVLAARLDRLGEARVLAQAASVIGREFSLTLLSIVVDAPVESLMRPLLQLVDAGIVSQQIGHGLNEYTFRHTLVRTRPTEHASPPPP